MSKRIRITVEDYRATTGSLEWAIEIDGMLWASGDCASESDGIAKATAELRAAGIEVLA